MSDFDTYLRVWEDLDLWDEAIKFAYHREKFGTEYEGFLLQWTLEFDRPLSFYLHGS